MIVLIWKLKLVSWLSLMLSLLCYLCFLRANLLFCKVLLICLIGVPIGIYVGVCLGLKIGAIEFSQWHCAWYSRRCVYSGGTFILYWVFDRYCLVMLFYIFFHRFGPFVVVIILSSSCVMIVDKCFVITMFVWLCLFIIVSVFELVLLIEVPFVFFFKLLIDPSFVHSFRSVCRISFRLSIWSQLSCWNDLVCITYLSYYCSIFAF